MEDHLIAAGILFLFAYLRARPLAFCRSFCPPAVTHAEVVQRVLSYKDVIEAAGAGYNVPAALIAAIMHRESEGCASVSCWEPRVKDYSVGLMQIRCDTAKWLGFDNPYEKRTLAWWMKCFELESKVWTNVGLGAKYLRWQYERYEDWEKAISAYNAGSYTVANRKYVQDVLRLRDEYRKHFSQ